MKKFRFSMVFGICLVFFLTAGVLAQENIPTITLPISNLLEVRKDQLRDEVKNSLLYGVDYLENITHSLGKEVLGIEAKASPFESIRIVPHFLESSWNEVLMQQVFKEETDEWVEKEFADQCKPYLKGLGFSITLGDDSTDLLVQENLIFIYQDSTGIKKIATIESYELKESEKPKFTARIEIYVPLSDTDLANIAWFDLYVLNTKEYRKVDMRWELQKQQENIPTTTGQLMPQPENIPTITLPISNLLEVRKDLIRKEGNAFPGGWGEYFVNYKIKTVHIFSDEEARPFNTVIVTPYTSEMEWVEVLKDQDQNFETDEWAEKRYQKINSPNGLVFQIFLYSDSLNLLLAEDGLRFIYQDSTGAKKDGEIYHYELNETKKPDYEVEIYLLIPLLSNPQDITWFSLHILNKETAGRIDIRWDFRKD